MVMPERCRFQYRPLADLTESERAAWAERLAASPECRSAFLSPQYADAVARSGNDVAVMIGYDRAVPVWFMPLQRHTGWIGRFGVFEPAGGVMTDYFGAVGSSRVMASSGAICRASGGRVAAILFTHLDEAQQRFGLAGDEPRVGLRTRIGDSAEAYWESLRQKDKKLVQDTGRREKKLARERGDVTFEWQSSHRDADLQALIRLKTAQYTRTGKASAPLFEGRNLRLLERLASSADEECEGVLSSLRCGGRLIAAHFGLRCRDALHVWFPVYDADYAGYSPGRILLKHIIEHAPRHGVCLLDRGEGDTPAKRDFANEEHTYFRGLWTAPSLQGFIARAAVSLYWRL
jgi:CelD/BcsL family acetyltransferase involved in cellulose biosynthesis